MSALGPFCGRYCITRKRPSHERGRCYVDGSGGNLDAQAFDLYFISGGVNDEQLDDDVRG